METRGKVVITIRENYTEKMKVASGCWFVAKLYEIEQIYSFSLCKICLASWVISEWMFVMDNPVSCFVLSCVTFYGI